MSATLSQSVDDHNDVIEIFSRVTQRVPWSISLESGDCKLTLAQDKYFTLFIDGKSFCWLDRRSDYSLICASIWVERVKHFLSAGGVVKSESIIIHSHLQGRPEIPKYELLYWCFAIRGVNVPGTDSIPPTRAGIKDVCEDMKNSPLSTHIECLDNIDTWMGKHQGLALIYKRNSRYCVYPYLRRPHSED